MTPLKHVIIYTDGACSGNPGPGGYGTVLLFGKHRKELSAGFRKTTNNRMELLALIAGLEALNFKCKVTAYTDSKYVENAINKGWAASWRKKGWMNKKEPRVNHDLWARLLPLVEAHDIDLKWVKGHAGVQENERCDELAVEATHGGNHSVDEGYESPRSPVSASAQGKLFG